MSFLTRPSVDTRRARPALHLVAFAACAAVAGSAQAHERRDAASWCADRCDQIVIDWNQQTHQVIKAADGYQDPMAASRILADVEAMTAAIAGLTAVHAAEVAEAAARLTAAATAAA